MVGRRLVMAVLAATVGLVTAATGAAAAPAPQPAPPGTMVVGGTPVPDNKYPFMATLQDDRYGDNAYDRHFCGGSLVGPRVVLTAAHCTGFYTKPEELKHLSVVVGRTLLSNNGQGQARKIVAVRIHPGYATDGTLDVALLYLDEPITTIKPIQLVTPGTDGLERPGRLVTGIGWGNTEAQPDPPGGGVVVQPDRLQEVDVPLVSNDECAVSYPTITDRDLCAGRTGKDTCQGDSGGPLFVKVPGRDTFIQIGVVSRGRGCGTSGFPGIYARLSNTTVASLWWRPGLAAEQPVT